MDVQSTNFRTTDKQIIRDYLDEGRRIESFYVFDSSKNEKFNGFSGVREFISNYISKERSEIEERYFQEKKGAGFFSRRAIEAKEKKRIQMVNDRYAYELKVCESLKELEQQIEEASKAMNEKLSNLEKNHNSSVKKLIANLDPKEAEMLSLKYNDTMSANFNDIIDYSEINAKIVEIKELCSKNKSSLVIQNDITREPLSFNPIVENYLRNLEQIAKNIYSQQYKSYNLDISDDMKYETDRDIKDYFELVDKGKIDVDISKEVRDLIVERDRINQILGEIQNCKNQFQEDEIMQETLEKLQSNYESKLKKIEKEIDKTGFDIAQFDSEFKQIVNELKKEERKKQQKEDAMTSFVMKYAEGGLTKEDVEKKIWELGLSETEANAFRNRIEEARTTELSMQKDKEVARTKEEIRNAEIQNEVEKRIAEEYRKEESRFKSQLTDSCYGKDGQLLPEYQEKLNEIYNQVEISIRRDVEKEMSKEKTPEKTNEELFKEKLEHLTKPDPTGMRMIQYQQYTIEKTKRKSDMTFSEYLENIGADKKSIEKEQAREDFASELYERYLNIYPNQEVSFDDYQKSVLRTNGINDGVLFDSPADGKEKNRGK